MEQFLRTKMLLGEEVIKKLSTSRVGVFGVGGVGSYVVEALSRMGVGSFLLIDSDKVSKTDINRQIIALHSTVGEYKVDVMKRRFWILIQMLALRFINAFTLLKMPMSLICRAAVIS